MISCATIIQSRWKDKGRGIIQDIEKQAEDPSLLGEGMNAVSTAVKPKNMHDAKPQPSQKHWRCGLEYDCDSDLVQGYKCWFGGDPGRSKKYVKDVFQVWHSGSKRSI